MICAAFDIALRTGWAIGERGKPPMLCSFVDLPGFSVRDLPRSLGSMQTIVTMLVRHHDVKVVGIEAALRGVHKKNKRGFASPVSAHGERVLTMLSGVTIGAAHNAGARVLEPVAPATWRKAVLGNGYPDNPKKAALDYCALMKWNITDHNVAEAACILQWTLGQMVGR